MIIHKARHDGDGDSVRTLGKHLPHLLVLESNNILPVHFSQVVVNEHPIPTETRVNQNNTDITGNGKPRGVQWRAIAASTKQL